jgi:hypothetical protein
VTKEIQELQKCEFSFVERQVARPRINCSIRHLGAIKAKAVWRMRKGGRRPLRKALEEAQKQVA